MKRLASTGRKKIQLKRIESERERAVTLSKRRNGLFKKANELATLCHAQIAIILFSITGKPLSFGSPSVQSVVNKFLNSTHTDQPQPDDDFIARAVSYTTNTRLQESNEEFNELNAQLTNEKKQGQKSERYVKRLLGGKTYEDYVDMSGDYGLMQLKFKMEEMKRNKGDAACGPSTSNDEYEADLSKIGMPKDYLKL